MYFYAILADRKDTLTCKDFNLLFLCLYLSCLFFFCSKFAWQYFNFLQCSLIVIYTDGKIKK